MRLSRPAAALAWVYVALVLLIAVGVPYFSIISTSLIKLRGYGLAAGNFTLAHYVELFTENTRGVQALKNSLTLAVSSASLCAVLGTLLAAAVHGKRSRAARAVEAAGMLPEMLPGIVLVIGVMLFWNRLYRFIPLYNTMGIMVAAYVALFLPYTIQYVSSAYTQISDSLTAAAQVFGGSPAYVFRRARHAAAALARRALRLDDDLHHRLPRAGDSQPDRAAERAGGVHLHRARI